MTTVYFINSTTGYASGNRTILKTTDAGSTWEIQNPNFLGLLFAIHFTDVNTGYVAGNSGTVIKTTNGGIDWTSLNTGTNQHLWGLHFADANTGIAVGGPANNTQNIILRTTNSGVTWKQIAYTYSTCLLWSVRFISSTTGWITGWCNQILKTTNGGLNWYNQATPSSNYYRTSFFTSALTGYVVGEDASITGSNDILKTTDGGGTFVGTGTIANEVPSQFHLYQNYPNPFNPATKISYEIPKSGFVKLAIYNIIGKEVKTLVNEFQQAGEHAIDFKASALTSGVYFYRLESGEFSATKEMLLIK